MVVCPISRCRALVGSTTRRTPGRGPGRTRRNAVVSMTGPLKDRTGSGVAAGGEEIEKGQSNLTLFHTK